MKPRLVTAWAEVCSGPGWHNRVVWILLRYPDGHLETEALQTRNAEILALFDTVAACNKALVSAVRRALAEVPE